MDMRLSHEVGAYAGLAGMIAGYVFAPQIQEAILTAIRHDFGGLVTRLLEASEQHSFGMYQSARIAEACMVSAPAYVTGFIGSVVFQVMRGSEK